jgi:membrane-associated protease RseP (regulator of RpoE activity)
VTATDHHPPGAPPDIEPAAAPGASNSWLRAAVVVGLVVVLTVKFGLLALLILAGLLVSITLHELGHYIAAKRSGMLVTEFFLGFGPRIWSTRRGETEYGIKAVPAGAYVRIVGMHNLEEVPLEDEARTYRQATFPRRLVTILAGVTMNAIIALVLIYVLLAGVGVAGGRILPDLPKLRSDVDEVFAGSPAAQAGLRHGDQIVRLDGEPVRNFDTLRKVTQTRMGETIDLGYLRDGQLHTTTITPGRYSVPEDGSKGCGIGVSAVDPKQPTERVNPVAAVPRSFVELGRVTGMTVQGLGRLFSPKGLTDYGHQVIDAGEGADHATPKCVPVAPTKATGTPASPNRLLSIVGLFQIGTSAKSAALLLVLFAGLNITLVVINLVPLLPFDGGHAVIAIYERIQERRRHLKGRYFIDVAKLLPLTYFVVAVLFLLFVSSIYLDLASPITQ